MLLLVGAGNIAIEYSKVLEKLKYPFVVLGRSKQSANNFYKSTGRKVISGGLSINKQIILERKINSAIVATNVDELFEATKILIEAGVKNILVEKPVSLHSSQVGELAALSKRENVKLFVAFNRRFLPSIQKLIKKIDDSGGISSLHFEFTEIADIVAKSDHSSEIKQRWAIANSTHILDLAFWLIGQPKELSSNVKGALEWHSASSIHWGSGISENNIPFTYCSNWESAGRWRLDVRTKTCQLILEPIETLRTMDRGQFEFKIVDLDYKNIDQGFKPGFYPQISDFLQCTEGKLCSISELASMMPIYEKIYGYK